MGHMAELFERLQCVTTVLGALKGKAQGERVGQMEAATLVRMIQSRPISADDLATAMTRVAMVGFQGKDEDTVMEALSAKFLANAEAPPPPAPGGSLTLGASRLKQQDFSSFVSFLTASAWIEIRDSGTMSRAADLLVALGLRSPTEATVRDLAVAYLMANEGPEAARLMPALRRTSFMSVPRKYFHKALVGAPALETWQLVLEESPQALRLRRPGLYANVYSTEDPVPMPFSHVEYEWFRTHTPQRRPKGSRERDYATPSSNSEAFAPLMEVLKMVVPQLQADKKTPSLENLTIFNRSPSGALTTPKPAKLPGGRFRSKR